ncbi:alpha/beta hydrolase [Bradyrhizobium liaoningense]|uniref:alpha/beta hydrolase n=1 Tax=Bradyrhizobium liaoningense TaxID=43992 RepID=UPI001BA83C9F|nr:alpha/beta fold hydrolase [Bradyrhizobium liaoningense]MBR1066885.1 alpha/beta fold hydrolase [Bradyrhizobium liaoningense]
MRLLIAIAVCIILGGCMHSSPGLPHLKRGDHSSAAHAKKRVDRVAVSRPGSERNRKIVRSKKLPYATGVVPTEGAPPDVSETEWVLSGARLAKAIEALRLPPPGASYRARKATNKEPHKREGELLDEEDRGASPVSNKRLQPVYFSTNREMKAEPLLGLSSITARRSTMKYGLTIVSVPKEHEIGKVERPKFSFLTWSRELETDDNHFRIKSLTVMERDMFVERLRADSDAILLFIHGFNVKFDDAIYKAAQIAYDANFGGSVLVFSWPSAGNPLRYDYDRISADYSVDDLLRILKILTEEIGDKKIYVVAHSLGNQILVDALQQAAIGKANLNITELVLAAPDVDRGVFLKKAAELKSVAKNMTIYASSTDKALLASDVKAWGTRMGYIDKDGPNLVEGIETIDVTAVGDDMFGLGHSTYSASRAVLDDLGRLISSKTHMRPHERTPTLKFMPDKENVKYWLYPR